jgi:hypothetical protein
MSNDKKIIRCRSISIDLDDLLDGKDFADVKRNLDRLEDKIYYGQGETAKFRVEATYSGEYVYLDVFREETDAEYDARLKKESAKEEKLRKAKEKKLEIARKLLMEDVDIEKAEYIRLKEKYGESV